jgi:hypothetical protein
MAGAATSRFRSSGMRPLMVLAMPSIRTSLIDGLTHAAAKAQWPLMGAITWVYAVLAIVLAAMAVLAFATISKMEEPRPHS